MGSGVVTAVKVGGWVGVAAGDRLVAGVGVDVVAGGGGAVAFDPMAGDLVGAVIGATVGSMVTGAVLGAASCAGSTPELPVPVVTGELAGACGTFTRAAGPARLVGCMTGEGSRNLPVEACSAVLEATDGENAATWPAGAVVGKLVGG